MIIFPSLYLTVLSSKQPDRYPLYVVLTGWGNSFVSGSFFFLPWLDLQPLKHFGLEWLFDALPFAELFAKWIGKELVVNLIEKLSGLEILFQPPGWLTLLITAPIVLWPILLCLGGMIIFTGFLVAFQFRSPKIGKMLVVLAIGLLAIVYGSLPAIDGIGERAFPHPLTVVIPLLGAKINWLGPAVMILGLVFLAIGGFTQFRTGEQPLTHGVSDE